MRNERHKLKSKIRDNSSATQCSEKKKDEIEDSLTELGDNSITFYSTIQSIWHEYQTRISSIPCLDLLAALASQEVKEKNK